MSVVLITGCSSGFGLLTAVELARRGHAVVASMRNLERRGDLDAALAEAQATAEVVPLDVTDPASVDAAVAGVLDRHGRLDVVVNNAGVAHGAPVEEIDLGELDAVLATNVMGPLRVIQAALPAMRAAGRGHIVNVTSVAAFVAPPFMGAYAASKHAIDALGEALASEVAPFGIAVTNVAPAAYETAMVSVVSDVLDAVSDESPYADRLRTMITNHGVAMRANNDARAVAAAIADAIEASPPPARVVVPETSAAVVAARGATSPEHLRAMLAASYGV